MLRKLALRLRLPVRFPTADFAGTLEPEKKNPFPLSPFY
jgi:hypothetical protein